MDSFLSSSVLLALMLRLAAAGKENSTNPSGCASYLELVFVIDESAVICNSTAQRRCVLFSNIIGFCEEALRPFLNKNVVSLVKIDTEGQPRVFFLYRMMKQAGEFSLEADTDLNLAEAIEPSHVLRYVRRVIFEGQVASEAPKVAVILTDGEWEGLDGMDLEDMRDSEIRFYAVGVGNVDLDLLKRLSSTPRKLRVNYYPSVSTSHMRLFVSELKRLTKCSDSLLYREEKSYQSAHIALPNYMVIIVFILTIFSGVCLIAAQVYLSDREEEENNRFILSQVMPSESTKDEKSDSS